MKRKEENEEEGTEIWEKTGKRKMKKEKVVEKIEMKKKLDKEKEEDGDVKEDREEEYENIRKWRNKAEVKKKYKGNEDDHVKENMQKRGKRKKLIANE